MITNIRTTLRWDNGDQQDAYLPAQPAFGDKVTIGNRTGRVTDRHIDATQGKIIIHINEKSL